MSKVRIMLADDHKILLETLFTSISMSEKIEVVGTAKNGVEVMTKLKNNEADVLVCDIQMPVMDGISTILKVKEQYPRIKILMLSMLDERETITTCFQAGADGFISKKAGRLELEKAILAVSAGETYLDKSIYKDKKYTIFENPSSLTRREIEVLKLMAKGFKSLEIGEQLYISLNTVETHRKNIFKKLKVKNQAGAIFFAIKYGLCV